MCDITPATKTAGTSICRGALSTTRRSSVDKRPLFSATLLRTLEDVPPLLTRFLEQFARSYGLPTPEVSPSALQHLIAYSWPGNVRELKNLAERLVVRADTRPIELHDLPLDVLRGSAVPAPVTPAAPPAASAAAMAVGRVDDLFDRLVTRRESFWTAVYPLFMDRDMTRDELRAIVRKGLERTSGSYRVLVDLFNMAPGDYKRFLSFLRKHQCHEAFQPFRTANGRVDPDAGSS